MNLEQLEESGLIFYRTIVGSYAYGTNTPSSDTDIKGFYWVDPEEYLSLNPPVTQKDGQISDERNDTTFYSLYKAFTLLATANPNMIELLWMPEECMIFRDNRLMDLLLEDRDLFISKQAYFSHAEYARKQIKKARGSNKKVHNPQPKERPVKEDFCRVILLQELMLGLEQRPLSWTILVNGIGQEKFPFRPIPIKETNIDLSKHHVASLEHSSNMFRLYHYGERAKGVFRGDDMLVCESIPKEDEWQKIVGLLEYDKNEYDKAVKVWKSYWDWMKFRNSSRWIDQEKGVLNYDAKNMCHCMRLMMASENILTTGEPTVRFEGEKLEYLMRIRNAELAYEELMERVDELDIRLKDLYLKSGLPEQSNPVKLNKLYRKIMEVGSEAFV